MTTQPSTASDGLVEVDDAFDPDALPPAAGELVRDLAASLHGSNLPTVRANPAGVYLRAGEARLHALDVVGTRGSTSAALREQAGRLAEQLLGFLALAAAFEVAELRDDEESAQAAALALTGATNVEDIPADVLDRARASVRSGAIVVKRSAR